MSNGRLPARVEQVLREAASFQALVSSLEAEFDDQLEGVRKALTDARAERAVAEAARDHALASAVTAEERGRADFAAGQGKAQAEAAAARAAAEVDLAERQQLLDALLHDKARAFALIADAFADWDLARAEELANELEEKDQPALVAAQVLRQWGQETAGLRRQLKVAEWIVKLYEFHFPWLEELREPEEEADFVTAADGSLNAPGAEGEEVDPAQHWLTAEEFRRLPSAERNQLALDRYLRSRKSRWQIGRDYERYVGYLREQDGCRVSYQGIFKGLEDLGRDLLAEKDGNLEVIQCKRWSQSKVIHEKHIFQLYGTMIATRIDNPAKTVSGTFVTTTSLSERAREFARQLEIRVEENFPLGDYPRIKCNIARPSGERIYHLPFDQQYDTTLVEPERGELWLATVAEAEEAGFRRAFRWRGGEGGASTSSVHS
jgi:Restriction endonuclease